MLRQIEFLNSPAGGGKTHNLISEAHELARRDTYVLFCQPTIDLLNQTIEDTKKRFPSLYLKTIHKHNSSKPVAEIIKYLFHPYPGPQVLFITQSSLERINADFDRSLWHLIVDEIPQVTQCYDQNLTESHKIVTSLLARSPVAGTAYDIVSASDVEQLKAIADNKNGDAVWEQFKDLANITLSPRWESYVDRKAYEDLINGSGSRSKLTVFSLLRPEIYKGFRSVTVSGACFRDSLLYHYWSKLGVKFVEAADCDLRYSQHENGEELTILWAIEHNWSKWLMNQREGQVIRMMEEAVLKEFGGADFLYAQNKGHDLFKGITNATLLPNAPHGLNQFQHIPNVAFLPARNLTPAHCKFLERMMGLSGDQIATAIHRQVAYQTVMRGALRDPGNHVSKRIFVPDLGTAEWLRSLFPGATLRKLESDFENLGLSARKGRKKVHASGKERKRTSREKKRRG